MVPRASFRWAGRLASSYAKKGRTSTDSSRTWQQSIRRGYASQGSSHGAHKPSSDLPWAITSAVVTIPAAVYLLQSSPENGHGHSHEDEGHGEEHKGEHDEEESEVGATGATIPDLRKSTSEDGEGKEGEAGEDGGENANESESEEKPEGQSDGSGSEGEPQVNTPDTSDDERDQNVAHETDSGGNVEGVQFKGATSGGTREREQGDTRKHIPDAKGGNKKRIESDYGNRLGVVKEDESDNTGDKPATSKPPGNFSTQSGKQEGLSNTDTKHSTNIEADPEKSKKGEGTPETAKSKGTISPQRPQAENRPAPDESSSQTR